MATIVTDHLTICPGLDHRSPGRPSHGKTRSMSPEELRERLERAGLTPHRLSYLVGVEPNEGSKWTRGDRPVPKGRVAQIIELTDFVAERGAAAVPFAFTSADSQRPLAPRSPRRDRAGAGCFAT